MVGNEISGVILQERDRHLIRELAIMRFVDIEQAKVVCGFGSYNRTHDRLSRLVVAGVLRRFYMATPAGGRTVLFCATPLAAELTGEQLRAPKRRSRHLLTADLFASHQMALNQVYLSFRYGSPPSRVAFKNWRSFSQPLSKQCLLTPDGYIEIATEEVTKAMFVEVDLSTESRTVWQKKIASYVQLAVSGEFTALLRQPRFRVLVVSESHRRMENLRALAAKTTDKIFRFSTLALIKASGPFSPIWLRPVGQQTELLA